MKKYLLFIISIYTMNISAAPVFTSADIDLVFAGYPDGSIAFIPKNEVVNPANCQNPEGYFMPSDHDTRGALSILLSAKMANKKVHFSVRDDICHTIEQTDGGQKLPVIQRIAIQ